jgi:hypothetical protein
VEGGEGEGNEGASAAEAKATPPESVNVPSPDERLLAALQDRADYFLRVTRVDGTSVADDGEVARAAEGND